MIADRPVQFEEVKAFEVVCPDCGHVWECTAKGRIISCGVCGKKLKNPNNPYINKPKPQKVQIICSVCNRPMLTGSTRYRISCSNCGAWILNENATYKPTR